MIQPQWTPRTFGSVAALIELGDDLRAGTAFPRTALQPADDADDDVVHHESEERFVGVPLALKKAGISAQMPPATAPARPMMRSRTADGTLPTQ